MGRSAPPVMLVKLTITMDVAKILGVEGTGIHVDGPIKNKALCYMMLELARDEITRFADKAAASPIIDPTADLGVHSTGG